MEILIFLFVQMLLFAFALWLVNRSRGREEGVPRRSAERGVTKQLIELREARKKSLSMPLTELARPQEMQEIIGQEEGIRALRAAMCGKNPQHVLLYGPPGVGKTCAARLVLEEAKKNPDSPFGADAAFVEVDATCVRFDERAIADPLIGSVHDPIYQGAGALGSQGVPQPKPGAVSKAHCGVLFLDEIGELHPVQLNKLLKVLEDRRVHFDSAYYSPENTGIPAHIHDIFQNGLPADFRLIGATTRAPEEMPPALRSRCVELFFKPLGQKELASIAAGAANRLGMEMDAETSLLCASYCASGRDAVNIVQLAAGGAEHAEKKTIAAEDVEWVAECCRHSRQTVRKLTGTPRVGVCTGLAVTGGGQGIALEIECSIKKTKNGHGRLYLGGMVEEEELDLRGRRLKRKGTAHTSAENVRMAFLRRFGLDLSEYDIAFNVPGGVPMDGPSAGIALAVALMSALSGEPPVPFLALTGEITASGAVRPVGGVREKLQAAAEAGAEKIVIPEENMEERFRGFSADVIPVGDIAQVMRIAFGIPKEIPSESGTVPLGMLRLAIGD